VVEVGEAPLERRLAELLTSDISSLR
jgi:hypothetical protein